MSLELNNNDLTVKSLSFLELISSPKGNSNNWDSAYTTVKSNTAADSFDLSYEGTLPYLLPLYTVPPQNLSEILNPGTQITTQLPGKWINALSIVGANSLIIDNLLSVSSSNLVGTRDFFSFSNTTRLSSIKFPALTIVGGSFNIISNGNSNNLKIVDFSSLASVNGSFAVMGFGCNLNGITSLSFPSLKTVNSTFSLAGNSSSMSSLTSVNFPVLTSIAQTATINSGSLNSITEFNFPSLKYVGGALSINASSTLSLTGVNFPSLVSIGTTLTVNSNSSMNGIASLIFPALTSTGSTISINTSILNLLSLYSISFPALVTVGGGITLTNSTGQLTNLNSFTIGQTLKHLNGNFTAVATSGTTNIDRNTAWAASTFYPSYTLVVIPAAAFSSTTTGLTVTVDFNNHGLQTGDIVSITGLNGTTAGNSSYNVGGVTVTRINDNQFTYNISTATTQIPTGDAILQRVPAFVTPVTKNGKKYICTGAGTSGSTEPAWPTIAGQTVTDGTVTWKCEELSHDNILTRLEALNGTNGTIRYGANRFISLSVGSASITINSISTAAGVATVTCATSHGFTTGTHVAISGCSGTALRYNGIWTIIVTGSTTFTINVPTDLNGVAGAGTMRVTSACAQYTGITPKAAIIVTGAPADAHAIYSSTQLVDSDNGLPIPDFPAGIYTRNGTANGFAKYSCIENGWDMWYDTTSKRWCLTPSLYTGTTNATIINNYAYTPKAVPLITTSSANPAVITSSQNHGVGSGSVFTVVIEGCSNTALNGSWTATSTGLATFTIPADGSGGATSNSGTVTVLNQQFNQGRLINANIASPIQGVLQTITSTGHGFSTGDFIHFYGAVGTHSGSISDLNTSASLKSTTSAITVLDADTFTCIRYSNTQPYIGIYNLSTTPHMRKPSVNDIAYYNILKMRSRGVAVSTPGTTGS